MNNQPIPERRGEPNAAQAKIKAAAAQNRAELQAQVEQAQTSAKQQADEVKV